MTKISCTKRYLKPFKFLVRLWILSNFLTLSLSATEIDYSSCLPKTTAHAAKLSAIKFGIDERTMVKIAYLESSFTNKSKLHKNKNGSYDIGIFQINSSNWFTECKEFDLSNDYQNADCAAKLIKKHKRHSATDPDWLGRYHSGNKELKNIYIIRLIYADNYLKKCEILTKQSK